MSTVSARTQLLLEAPALPLLLRLSAPNLGEAAARITFLAADALFVSWVGGDALAAVGVVFPLFLMLQVATASGLGSGVSAAIGRALGAGDAGAARALAGTSAMLALSGGAATTGVLLLAGPALYTLAGLGPAAREMAVVYGAVLFGGSVFVWTMNLLANVCRGAGTMTVPATAIVVGELFHLGLSPALILGAGPLPALGMAGAALAALAAYVVGTAILLGHLLSARTVVRLEPGAVRLRRADAVAILRVGVPSALGSLLFPLTMFVMAGLVARLGDAAAAAFAAASRLELLQVPLTFAFGSSVIALIATAIAAPAHAVRYTGVNGVEMNGLSLQGLSLQGTTMGASTVAIDAIELPASLR